MYIVVSILILIAAILLVLIVLVQNPKGGGLTSGLTGSNQMMGVRKTTDFLEKATWTLAVLLLAFSLVASMTIKRAGDKEKQEAILEKKSLSMPSEDNVGNWPTTAPEEMPEMPMENPEGTE